MSKQKLEQNKKLSLTASQIQFLNLLQIPILSLKKRIEKELEENPVLEEIAEEEKEDDTRLISRNYKKSLDLANVQIEEKTNTLSEHLHQQLISINLDESTYFLVSYLINSLNDSGFLNRDLYSISSDLLINNNLDVGEEKIASCVKILQQLDPCGVGAYDLRNCLLIQLTKKHPDEKMAIKILQDYYEYFVNKNFNYLTSKLNIKNGVLKKAYSVIESLNPIPSNGFSKTSNQTEYITADFNVFLKGDSLEVQANKANNPGLGISNYYLNLLEETTDKEAKKFLKENVEKAIWFKNALIKRDATLLNIIKAILQLQEKYFISGNEKDLKPMKLADIAQIVKVDISTISRASNSKYIETFFGIFKLKDLFSEAYKKVNGEKISTKEIKSDLKNLIENEDKLNPFTDSKLSDLLGKENYYIARRTVAKYRESMGIPIAKLRKKI